MPGVLNIGTLSGKIELEDNLSSAIDLAIIKIDALDKKFGGVGQRIAEGAASFFTAEAAISAMKFAAEFAVDALKQLTIEGAAAAGVADNFKQLNENAGRLGETLLGELREGLRNTVTDLELMKTINQDLAAGMNLTDKQFRTLADGAFALATATGTDVKSALDAMNDAMLTGRTRAVAMLTGKIDLAKAEEDYALKLGASVEQLTAEEKIQAAREIILLKVTEATKRLGEQTVSINDMVAQAATSWGNFVDELGKSIATSPVIITAFVEIRNAIMEAFGGNQEDAIKRITKLINEGAITALKWAQTIVDGVALAGISLLSMAKILESVAQGWRAIIFASEWLVSGGMTKELDELYNTMAKSDAKLKEYTQTQEQLAVSSGNLNEKIEEIRQKMIAADEATVDLSKAQKDATATTEDLGEAVDGASDSISVMALESKEYKAEAKALSDTLKDQAETLAKVEKAQKEMAAAAAEALKIKRDANNASVIAQTAALSELQTIEETANKVRMLSGEYIALADAKALSQQGGAFEVNRGNLAASAKAFNIPKDVAFALAEKGFSFQEIIAAWQSGTVSSWVPHGPRIPGFKEGGVGDFGSGTLAMLHGREAIVPLDKGLGNITNIFHVNGTAADVARKVSEEFMRTLKAQRQFRSA